MAIREEQKLIVFRVDASLTIGTGHVMRCLTLADELKARGSSCRFICREHPGHLLELIRERGHEAIGLSTTGKDFTSTANLTSEFSSHQNWLGADWATDAEQTLSTFNEDRVEWLVLDHYALDAGWELALRPACFNLMVIDDLADRPHECDLLLDQNLGRRSADYSELVPVRCNILTGPLYSLLRPEFAMLRNYSLSRRTGFQLKQLLVSMGGVDQPDATSKVLKALKGCPLPTDCRITVVMGTHAPWSDRVKEIAANMPWRTDVRVDVRDMAKLMADSDLAIGAAGSTSWERACLGLPTLLVVLSENQIAAANRMVETGVARALPLDVDMTNLLRKFMNDFIYKPGLLASMSQKASALSEGHGCKLVVSAMKGSEIS